MDWKQRFNPFFLSLMMTVLVTGGTGFLGKRLVEKLIAAGNDVTVFAKKEDAELRQKSVKLVLGDMLNQSELASAFTTVDIVYHLAANLDESDTRMYDENVNGTKNVIELSKNFHIKKIIFMGSCGALGDIKVAREDLPYNPRTKYEKSKAESEKLIINSGIPYTIIRAPVIIGPNEIWRKIFEAAKNHYPIIGSGKNHFHLAYIDDVVDLLFFVKDNAAAINQILHIAVKDSPTYEDVYRMICESLGVEMTKKHISVWLIKFLSVLHTFSRRLRGKRPSLVMMGSSIDRLIRDRVISIEKAKSLGFSPKYDTTAAINETTAYFKSRSML